MEFFYIRQYKPSYITERLFIIMQKIFVALCVCISLALNGQTGSAYKKITDIIFSPGDVIFGPTIYFGPDCQFIYAHKDSVMIIADFIKKHPAFKIEIGVHTDSVGDSTSNVLLSKCRANTICDFLTKEIHLPEKNIVAKGYGSSQPRISDKEIQRAASRSREAEHAKNRRVEIKILET